MDRKDQNPKARTIIRLNHILPEGEEINAILPDTLAEFEEALARGELPSPDRGKRPITDRKDTP